ncbi:MAG: GntR family transcriptional regulator [Erysipelotrichaceae bacterium]
MENNPLVTEIIIDKESPIPLYYQFKVGLVRLIKSGYFKRGKQIPTEMEFTRMFEISRPTIRQALNEMIAEGLISRQRAKGTFVVDDRVKSKFFSTLMSFDDEMISLGKVPSTRLISSKVVEASSLPFDTDEFQNDEFVEIKRVRSADQEKVVFVTSYVPFSIFSNTLPTIDEKTRLYKLLEDAGHSVFEVSRKFTAVNANKEVARLLDVQVGKALLFVETMAYDDQKNVVEIAHAYYQSEISNFSIHLTKTA